MVLSLTIDFLNTWTVNEVLEGKRSWVKTQLKVLVFQNLETSTSLYNHFYYHTSK